MSRKTVMISSTSLDLPDHRAQVREACLSAGFFPEMMESLPARDADAIRVSMEMVDRADVYLGILAHRYGHVPEGHDISITEMEFRRADDPARERKTEILVFLIDPKHAITADMMELSDAAQKKLAALKDHACRERGRALFKSPDDLRAQVLQALLSYQLREVQEQLGQRDAALGEVRRRNADLEKELAETRTQAVARVLDEAAAPDSGRLAERAREALLRGETREAEQLLFTHEQTSAEAAEVKRHQAADAARQIAALALGRDLGAALEALRRAAGYEPEDFWTRIQFGDALALSGNTGKARAEYEACKAIAEKRLKAAPDDADRQRDLSVSHERIGDMLAAQGDSAGALAAYRDGLAIAEGLAAADPRNTEWQRDLSVSHDRIGDMLAAQGDSAGALAEYRASLAIREGLAAADIRNTEWQRDLSISHERIGDMLAAQGDSARALAAYRGGLAIAEGLAAADPRNTGWQLDVAVSCWKLGTLPDAVLTAAERAGYLQRGAAVLEALAGQGKLPQRAETWPGLFQQALADLGQAAAKR